MNLVITGANRGIGLELTRQSLAQGNTVHAGTRDPAQARELTALVGDSGGRLHVRALDVASDDSVHAFAAALTGPVELLINNAGLRTRRDDLEDLSLEDALQMLQVNALGTLRVTRALLPRLREARGAKIASLSSGLGSIADNTSGGGYDMGGASAPTQVSDSAAGLLAVMGRLSLQDSGSFFDFRGERIAW